MRIAIIINGISRKKKSFFQKILPALKTQFQVEVFETQYSEHAVVLAREAIEKKFDCILSCGGDGTLNQVVNGILQSGKSREDLPILGVVPLGTGNDFAKHCGIRFDVHQLVQLLNSKKYPALDVGFVSCSSQGGDAVSRYFINVCSVGMGPSVVKKLSDSSRWMGPDLTYLWAITTTFFSHNPQDLTINTLLWKWAGKVRVFGIANGKTFGNGLCIAPDSISDDGIFSTFLAGELKLLKFLFYLQYIKGGKKINDELIIYNKAEEIELNAPSLTMIETEGELIGILPAKIKMLKHRINFLK